jgi:hypothetical protein
MKPIVIATALAGLAGLLIPTLALASWGDGECYEAETHHCYALTEWIMEGGSESVKGATFVPDTTSIDVPEFAAGAFVTNEGWVKFVSSEGWMEAGQIAGYGLSCCTLHAFVALATSRSGETIYGFEKYIFTGVAEPRNVYLIEDPANNGSWCWIIWGTNAGCKSRPGYWETYSHDLEAGVEIDSNARPGNTGSQEVNAISHSGVAKSWSGAKTSATGYISPGPAATGELYLTPNYDSNYPGNADWGTR